MAAIVGAWIMVRRGPSVPDHSTLILRIGGELAESPPNDVFGQVTGGARAKTVRSYVDALRRAKDRCAIESVLIMPTPFASPFWGKVQEIRDAVVDFKKSGKRISAYLEYGGEREYYLASAADRIYLMPTSGLDVAGVATYEVFLERYLDKIGAQADFEKIGDYKTAPNQLTQTTFTPAHREMTESLTRDMYEQLVRGIAEAPQEERGGGPRAHRSGAVPGRACDESRPGRYAGLRRSARRPRRRQQERHGRRRALRPRQGRIAAARRAPRGCGLRHGRHQLRRRRIRSAQWRGHGIERLVKAIRAARADDRCARSWCASTAQADRASRQTSSGAS